MKFPLVRGSWISLWCNNPKRKTLTTDVIYSFHYISYYCSSRLSFFVITLKKEGEKKILRFLVDLRVIIFSPSGGVLHD